MIGVVLAGGASQRMGRPKADVEIGGSPMATYVVAALAAVCSDVIASGGPVGELDIVADPEGLEHRGPIVGVVSVLQRVGEPILTVAVDQPWVRVATLEELAARCDGRSVVPLDGGSRQVTCAVYTPQFLPDARAALGGGSIQSALDAAVHDSIDDWVSWGEDGRSWFSVDVMDDIEVGLSRFGAPSLAGS